MSQNEQNHRQDQQSYAPMKTIETKVAGVTFEGRPNRDHAARVPTADL